MTYGGVRPEALEHPSLRAKVHTRRSAGLGSLWYEALRIFAVVLLLQLSGIAHAAVDTWDSLANQSLHCSDGCENDDRGQECPPGCPKCHCFHVSPVVLQERAAEIVALPTSDGTCTLVPNEASAPSSGEPLFVFRPPKLAPLLA